jgi:hypothetical protein
LDQLASKLGAPPKNPKELKGLPDPANILPSAEDAQLARELGRKQRLLRDQLSKAATDTPNADAVAERQAMQKKHSDLADAGKKLSQNLEKAADTKPAADAANQAADLIEQAGQNQGKGKLAEAAAARRKALDSLKQATEALGETGDGAPAGGTNPDDLAKAAGKAREATAAMNDAIQNAKDGKPEGKAMSAATDKLKQAAEQLAPGKKDGSKGEGNGNQPAKPDPTGPASAEVPPSPLTANLGKPWGELPGEVKAQITQELKARYGEDYARIIKLYFEQLAERK